MAHKSKLITNIEKALLIAIILPGLALSSFAMQPKNANAAETVTVTIMKYIDGEMATAESAEGASFPMSATWSADNIGTGTGEYALSSSGETPYQAMTVPLDQGASYSTNEILTGETVGASCEGDAPTPYALTGYTTGETEEEAMNAEKTMTIPAFTDMQTNKYVIVWNDDCSTVEELPETVTVTISKFVQKEMATSESADDSSFPMSATWATTNFGAGTGEYTLGPSNETPYEAMTAEMDRGSSYSTNEILTGETVGASCEEGKPYALEGYTTGDTHEEAMEAEPEMTMTPPSFTDLQEDQYVIVWNRDCALAEGELEGEVTGSNGTLEVTSVETIDSQATANGSFEDGWEYAFNVTVPNDEPNVAMKFSNWQRNGGGGTIPVANNMRISSAQADNEGATVLLTAENTYSTPALHMTGDLNPEVAGRQVRIIVEVAVPNGTPDGSYTTTYGIQTTE